MLYLFVFLGLDGAITKLNRRQNRRYRDARKWVSTSFPRSLQYFRVDTTAFFGLPSPVSSFLPSFLFVCLSLVLFQPRTVTVDVKGKVEKGNEEEKGRVLEHVETGVDWLSGGRRLESAGRGTEIRIEFALDRNRMGMEARYPKRRIGRKFFDSRRPLSKSRHSNRLDARNILLSPLSLATGRLLARVSNRPLIKSTLTPSPPGIRRKHFRESTWRKYLRKNRMHRYSPRTCAARRLL